MSFLLGRYLEKGEGGVQPSSLLRSSAASGPFRKRISFSLFTTLCSGCSFRHLKMNVGT